jgi:hypothetical protein
MTNYYRIFVNAPLQEVVNTISLEPSVQRFGANPVVPANKSHFGFVRHDLLNHVEINLINNIQQICSKLSKFGNCFVVQDLDNYGIEKYFNYKLLETKD